MKKLVLCAAFLSLVCVPLAAEAASPKSRPAQSCKVIAKRAADNAGNGRILTTAVFGGMSGLVIGSILSENNPKGEKRAGGLFGGGLIGGKGYRVQWQRDYKKAYAKCVR